MFERTGPTRCCAFLLPKVTYVKIVWCNSADLNIKVTVKRFRIVQLLRLFNYSGRKVWDRNCAERNSTSGQKCD